MNYRLSNDGKILVWVDNDIETFEVPKSVTIIGGNAFRNCVYLTNIIIPEGVTNINEYAFYKCIKLTNVEIPNSITYIGYGAFLQCKELTKITIPNIKHIKKWTFIYCKNLNIVNIPNVIDIEFGAFRDCNKLLQVNSKLNKEEMLNAFSGQNAYQCMEQYNAYLKRNRDYKLNKLENGSLFI